MIKDNVKKILSLIKQVCIALLRIRKSLATTCVLLNNEPGLVRIQKMKMLKYLIW